VQFVLFYHSLVSDWNHGNAHFLRGVATELLARGHGVRICEPAPCWSRDNLIADRGESALRAFSDAYPHLTSTRYRQDGPDIDALCDGADVIIAHEWNDHALIAALGRYRRTHPDVRLLFHDTHHRAITQPEQMAAYDLSAYDGALVYGAVLKDLYLQRRWTRQAWTWHEAADTRLFRPRPEIPRHSDLVWIGNWGDDERTAELNEFLLEPVAQLRLKATIHGVRYPNQALAALKAAGIRYVGYLPNYRAPEVLAAHRVTVHIPRRPYVEALPGIPTIRVFEALACGIPLISAPWEDREQLFSPGDYLTARTGEEMTALLKQLLNDPAASAVHAQRGLATIRARHTCAHRAAELLDICAQLGLTHTPAPSRLAGAMAK
jgi:spore maturation protein CgeB